MQEEDITNPPEEIKAFVRVVVDKLSKLPPDEIITLDNDKMLDSQGNIIVAFPSTA